MKNLLAVHRNRLLLAALLLLLGSFAYVLLRAGPWAPVPVTVVTVERRALAPMLFGVGTVEARTTHKIGPTFAGRLIGVSVQAGDTVKAGQLLAEIDPLDLDARLEGVQAALRRADAGILAAQAHGQEAQARRRFTDAQAARYELLLTQHMVSNDAIEAKRAESQVARALLAAAGANLDAARMDALRLRADHDALLRQRRNLRLTAPVDGVVSRRNADPGSTVLAGQAVIELVQPAAAWVNVRFDQQRGAGLRAEQPAQVVLRSQPAQALAGRVARVELHADPVTEELLAKVAFVTAPASQVAIGELAEVTVALAKQAAMPVVPGACVQRLDGQLGVWIVEHGALRFARVTTGLTDLEGRVQVVDGLRGGEQVVLYRQKSLAAHSRIDVVARLVADARP